VGAKLPLRAAFVALAREVNLNDQVLQQLADRAAISDLVNRYATAIDLRDWALLRTCFCDLVEADFTSFGTRDVFRGSADDWVAAVRSTIEGLDATQHLTANHVHEISGDSAVCTAYIRARHVFAAADGENQYTIGGYYSWHLERQGEEWRAAKYAITVTWKSGNRHILKQAARRSKKSA
jgi:hypothetical protein